MIVAVLLTALALLAAYYAVQLVRTARARGELKPRAEGVAMSLRAGVRMGT